MTRTYNGWKEWGRGFIPTGNMISLSEQLFADWTEEREEKDREIERLIEDNRIMNDALTNGSESLGVPKQYRHWWSVMFQRRHRKWALEQCRTWARHFCFYKDDAVRFHSDRADKAEAELEQLRKRLPPTDAPWTLKELDDAKARIAELEQELSWAIDAEQKAEKDVEERDGRIKELEEELGDCAERMERARSILQDPRCGGNPESNWGMLDTRIARKLLAINDRHLIV